jgi:hypothetical protein
VDLGVKKWKSYLLHTIKPSIVRYGGKRRNFWNKPSDFYKRSTRTAECCSACRYPSKNPPRHSPEPHQLSSTKFPRAMASMRVSVVIEVRVAGDRIPAHTASVEAGRFQYSWFVARIGDRNLRKPLYFKLSIGGGDGQIAMVTGRSFFRDY